MTAQRRGPDVLPNPLTAWAVTTGEAGMRTQARGLALAVADIGIEKTMPAGPAAHAPGVAEAFAAPFPDVLITCGRRSAGLARRLRRRGAKAMIAVHVQDPRCSLAAFDLVVAMGHDRLAAGAKVLKVATALHDLTPANLSAAAAAWRARLAPLGRPLAGVLLGGGTRRGGLAERDAGRLIEALARLRSGGAALAITPSRRTPETLLRRLRAAFAGDDRVWLWDGAGDNPYRGILALADALVVSGDSVSMISEALATGATVEVFDLGIPHFSQFIEPLIAEGAVSRFTGEIAAGARRTPIDATPVAAAAVRRLLQARREGATGESGNDS